jgi:lipopolysaccharide export LptBFGC system permease protein LptF
MLKRELVNLFHIIFVAPLLIYVGLMKSKCQLVLFHLLVALGLMVFVYHSYRYLTSYTHSNSENTNLKTSLNLENTNLKINSNLENTYTENNNNSENTYTENNNNSENNNKMEMSLEMNNKNNQSNIEMEVIDMGKKENNEVEGHQPNGLFESAFASINDVNSMNSVDGFTW